MNCKKIKEWYTSFYEVYLVTKSIVNELLWNQNNYKSMPWNKNSSVFTSVKIFIDETRKFIIKLRGQNLVFKCKH